MNKLIRKTRGGLTSPQGFKANGIACGIKGKKSPDLTLIYSESRCVAVGVFTKNRIQAESIKVTRSHLQNSRAQAIVVNSGNANCCNGKEGVRDAERMALVTADALGISNEDVLVASTGIIGMPLPIAKIERAMPMLVNGLSSRGSSLAAQAIMTTDTFAKESACNLEIGKKTVRIGGIAKGAGMISPHMATLLSFIATDAVITRSALKKALRDGVASTFNRISIDGDMSTNDSVLVIANGKAGNRRIELGKDSYTLFSKGLKLVLSELAKKIVTDGEGATKFLEVKVLKAKSEKDALKVARSVCESELVKAMFYGEDPNPGRIASAIGAAGVPLKEESLHILIGDYQVMEEGRFVFNKARLKKVLKNKNIFITINLKMGSASGFMWGCDLTEDYVKINANY